MTEDLHSSLAKGLQSFFYDIPFNRVIGLELTYADLDRVELRFDSKPELVGNYIYGILHGGVISAALDVAGGATAVVGAFQRMKDLDERERNRTLSKIGTIDIRVDYLRPGKGQWFSVTSRPLRTGNKVAVARMELVNQDGLLIAVGSGTYLCG